MPKPIRNDEPTPLIAEFQIISTIIGALNDELNCIFLQQSDSKPEISESSNYKQSLDGSSIIDKNVIVLDGSNTIDESKSLVCSSIRNISLSNQDIISCITPSRNCSKS